ncbi:type II toxin-antitoxin system Phd/YefM family antitoxin [Lamprocystis purpurea]|jgi:prevent-host-death family protein|uniref:type II toxin-antitoxin system Phd/YefM family antitoxin n=1 Tax=Lamprocystis purpurea TaxID=61598 RepID=UPI0003735368|nr:type II toxin-antitoxin system Phd/YefM family antitoxin [Lamprocystis purpurea]
MTEISVAKTRLTGLIHRVEGGEVVHLTRHGKSVAVFMSESDYAAMHPNQTRPGLWEAIVDWRTQAAFYWPDLTPEEVDGRRDPSPGRVFDWTD